MLVVAGLLFAGNYFYAQGMKRGTEIELHSETKAVNTVSSTQDKSLLEVADDWYNKQDPEILNMMSYDGLKLTAKFIQNKAETGKAVILVHGFRNTGDDMGKLAEFYYEQGFDILLPDARGHGDSEGDYIGYGWHDRLDTIDWIDVLINKYDETNIMLHGNSMGAATVLMASGEQLPDEVKAIVSDSAYSTMKEELTHQLKHIYKLPAFPLLNVTSMITKIRAGYTFNEVSAIKQVKKNTLPLFIIHGDGDDLVPTKMANAIYDAAGGDKALWIVPGAGHTKAFDNVTAEFEERLTNFMESVPAFRD
jgi:fermentation-respiration switch protein FrsA (DUF1100 family)